MGTSVEKLVPIEEVKLPQAWALSHLILRVERVHSRLWGESSSRVWRRAIRPCAPTAAQGTRDDCVSRWPRRARYVVQLSAWKYELNVLLVPLNAALYSPDSSLPTYGRPSSSHRRPVPPGLSPSPHVPYDVPRHSFDSRPGTKDARHLDPGVYPPNRAPPSLSAKPIQLAKSTPNLVGAVQAPTTAPRNIPRKAPPPYLPPSSNAHAPAASEPSPLLFVRPPTTARPGSSNGRLQSGPNGDSPSSAGRDGPRPSLPIGPPPQARLRPEIRHKKSHSTVHEREVVEDDDLPPLPPPQHRTLPMPHREGLQPRPRTSSRVDAPTKPRSKRRHLAVRPATADNADISRKKQSWRGQWNVDDIEEVRRRLREL